MSDAKQPAKNSDGFTEAERSAMKQRAKELKKGADKESDVLAKIAEMSEPDRALAERIHALVKAAAPNLTPKLWYGMPSYAKDGKIVCFFQTAEKFKARYATLGFNDIAALDDGTMWPTAFALTTLTPEDEARITDLVKRAVG
ncbi:iron chaperone [Nocardia sp. NPDC050406]|uniref:iron chaperone n=1 Tax=Nocardia sp. NPDC050406 TaxID=3364318 RepID=UPI0037B1F31D